MGYGGNYGMSRVRSLMESRQMGLGLEIHEVQSCLKGCHKGTELGFTGEQNYGVSAEYLIL